MTFITIDTKKKEALPFLEYIKTLSFVTVHKEPNQTTLKAMEAAEEGNTKKHKSAKDLIAFLNE